MQHVIGSFFLLFCFFFLFFLRVKIIPFLSSFHKSYSTLRYILGSSALATLYGKGVPPFTKTLITLLGRA